MSDFDATHAENALINCAMRNCQRRLRILNSCTFLALFAVASRVFDPASQKTAHDFFTLLFQTHAINLFAHNNSCITMIMFLIKEMDFSFARFLLVV